MLERALGQIARDERPLGLVPAGAPVVVAVDDTMFRGANRESRALNPIASDRIFIRILYCGGVILSDLFGSVDSDRPVPLLGGEAGARSRRDREAALFPGSCEAAVAC